MAGVWAAPTQMLSRENTWVFNTRFRSNVGLVFEGSEIFDFRGLGGFGGAPKPFKNIGSEAPNTWLHFPRIPQIPQVLGPSLQLVLQSSNLLK